MDLSSACSKEQRSSPAPKPRILDKKQLLGVSEKVINMSTVEVHTSTENEPVQLTNSNAEANRGAHEPFGTRLSLSISAPIQDERVGENTTALAFSHTTRFLVTGFIVCANMIQFISTFATINGGLWLSAALGRDAGVGKANWMAASYPLTQGTFVLVAGRLGAIYGYQRLALLGCTIFALFSLINAFCTTYISFVAVRALTGVGGGLFMPNAVAIIMTMVPPGRSRNLTMGFFAASPPIGGCVGGLLIGAFTERGEWKWLFILIAGLTASCIAALAYLLPGKEYPVDRGGSIDYLGAVLGLGSLLVFNVAWNQAPSVGWSTPYEITLVVLSVLMFLGFIFWEHKYAAEPIMPLKVFAAPTFSALVFVVLLSYMGFAITMWYFIAWEQLLRHRSVLQTGIEFIPFGLGSVFAVGLAAWLLPRLAAQYILAIGLTVVVASNLLLATMPVEQTFWSHSFAAILLSSFCPDFVYVAAQLIASNSVGRRHQGVAGSLIGTLNLYGNSLGLGFAGTIETEIASSHSKPDVAYGYRAALYFGMALALASLALDFAFVRMPKDNREGWDDAEEEVSLQDGSASTTAIDRQL